MHSRFSGVAGRLTNRDVLAIALPITLSNATVPLIGFVDSTVIGQLGEVHLLGAVALSTQVFNFLYFMFNFLRMGTTGLTAQAAGAEDVTEIAANLARPMMIGVAIGVTLVIGQGVISSFGFWLMGASARVAGAAQIYFDIRIWSAPATLANFALLGWFFGLGRARIAFLIQLCLTGLNIVLSVVFVLWLDWGVAGVATGTLVAEFVTLAIGASVALRELALRNAYATAYAITHFAQLSRLFSVSRDILIRTAGLQVAMSFFVAQGAYAGDLALAANHVLLNILMIAVYMIDGFAYASETLVGQAIGARQHERFRTAVRLSMQWAFGLSTLLSIGLWFAGAMIIDFMTTSEAVRETARIYLIWAVLVPVTSVWCFLLDGIFIGATATRTMRNMMLISLAGYFLAWMVLTPALENHGLWLSLHVLFILRALTLGQALRPLERDLFKL